MCGKNYKVLTLRCRDAFECDKKFNSAADLSVEASAPSAAPSSPSSSSFISNDCITSRLSLDNSSLLFLGVMTNSYLIKFQQQ